MNPIEQKSNVKNQQSYQVSGVLAENKQREGCLETPKIQRKRQYVTNLTDTLNIVFCLNIIWSNKVRWKLWIFITCSQWPIWKDKDLARIRLLFTFLHKNLSNFVLVPAVRLVWDYETGYTYFKHLYLNFYSVRELKFCTCSCNSQFLFYGLVWRI